MNKTDKHQPKQAIVIGGGISGLASAAMLAKQGWKVKLLERNESLGGRARVWREKGFKFDMGPSWYLMPEVFERFWSEFGKKPDDYYELIRLDPKYEVWFGDGSGQVFADKTQKNHEWFEKTEPGSSKRLEKFLVKMKKVYESATRKLIFEQVWNPGAYVDPKNIADLAGIFSRLRFWTSWDDEVRKYFKSEKIRQVLGFAAVFLGGSPFNTPALYSILTWADFGKGVWYPKGGMRMVVEGLAKLAEELGVEVLISQEVTEIVVRNGRAAGVRVGKEEIAAEAVVATGDLADCETRLVPAEYRMREAEYWKSRTMGISAMLLYWGVKRKISGLCHHTIYFSKNWEVNFREIFTDKVIPSDPSFYVSARSVTDPGVAPKNHEELFVLVPLAAGSYTEDEMDKLELKIRKKLEERWQMKLEPELAVKRRFGPGDFEKDYLAYQGTALGLAHTLGQSIWLRPDSHNYRLPGLFYAGQYTNPGVGVPMALVSGMMAAKLAGEGQESANEIFRKGSVTYYYSSWFFPKKTREEVLSLYAYVRVVDDMVDRESPDKEGLERWWRETGKAWKGGISGEPVVNEFVKLAKRRGFEWKWIEAFWAAMRQDLEKKRYESLEELDKYMHGSAEVVGLMMARIMELPKEADAAAAKLGKAMQFINFIRDVAEDRKLGRNYLGYAEADLEPEKWAKLVRSLVNKYELMQAEAEKGYKYIPRRYLVPIKTAAEMYKWTAKEIAGDPNRVWRAKIKPGKLKVVREAWRSWRESDVV